MKKRGLLAPLALTFALLAPAGLSGAVAPASKQFEIMPPSPASPEGSPLFTGATAVDLGSAGFAVGWDTDLNPTYYDESVRGVTGGRQVLPNGRLGGTFLASTDVDVASKAGYISLAPIGKTGRFVAAWWQVSDFGSDSWFRRFENGSRAVEPAAVRIGQHLDGRMDCYPWVAANQSGRFVVVWGRGPSYVGGSPSETAVRTMAQVFGPDGLPLTPEIDVTDPVPVVPGNWWNCFDHRVGMDAAGNFVVLGSGNGPLPGIWGRRFDPSGQPLGGPFQISAREGGVNLAMSPSGDFVAAWNAPYQGSIKLLSRFTADGKRTGPMVRLPSVYYPLLAMDRSGRVAVFWIDPIIRRRARTALAVFGPSLELLGPVVYDVPSALYVNVGVAFADDGRILTVWLGPHGPGAPNSILGRFWRVR